MSNTPPLSPYVSKNGFVFISGQVCLTLEGVMLEGTIEEQTHQVMKNIQEILEENKLTFNNVVKTTIYVTDMSVYSQINDVYAGYFENEYPAREVVCVKELPLQANVEISMIASK